MMDRVDTPPPGMVPPGMGGGPLPGVSAPPGTSVSFAEPPGESKLLDLERTLAAKDAVMEPEVLATLRDYVANGGKPAAAIELLSENYRGYAQMTGLLVGGGEGSGQSGAGRRGGGAGVENNRRELPKNAETPIRSRSARMAGATRATGRIPGASIARIAPHRHSYAVGRV